MALKTIRVKLKSWQESLNDAIEVMKLGGWKSMKSMEHYIRQSGIDIEGLNRDFTVLPVQEFSNVVQLHKR